MVEEEGLTSWKFEPKSLNGAAGNCVGRLNPKGVGVAPAWWKAKPLVGEGMVMRPGR